MSNETTHPSTRQQQRQPTSSWFRTLGIDRIFRTSASIPSDALDLPVSSEKTVENRVPLSDTADKDNTGAGGESIPPVGSPLNGWLRIKAIYTDDNVHMEKDVTIKTTRMGFIVGTLIGGLSGYTKAKQRYDMYSTGRTYLNARDALRRKWDFGIVMFVRNGLRTGIQSAALIGSIVFLTTHITLWRNHFSAWYFPVISATVGSILAFPIGLIGSLKALGLGISSGLSLSAIALLYAMSMDKSVNEAYGIFKREYESELLSDKKREEDIASFMAERKIPWRFTAIKQMKLEEEQRLLREDE